MFRKLRITKKTAIISLLLAVVFIYIHMLVIQHIVSMIVSYGLAAIALAVTASYLRKPLKKAKGKVRA